ncbi:MAG: hypothetical protein H6711_27315 [Myxococcales bacterium]|nr:hypothetical protein [Myxococcales bacterium]
MNTRILLLTLGIALAACGGAREGEGTPAASAPPAPAERAAEPGEAAPPSPPADASGGAPGEAGEAADASARLLRWLDPEAVGVTWVSARHDLDADALVAVFGVPPRAARMLRELEVVDEGLALVLGEEKAKAWLRPEAMAMLPAVAHGTYVVRLLEGAPPDELRAALEAAEMEASEVEGFTLWEPTGSFPWRIMIADASTIAMIPRQEIGSGIGPLTAARDLPPSELERELGRALSSEPDILLDLFAQGPLLHMDTTDDVGLFRLSVRRWQGAGLDTNVLLQPLGDAGQMADELEARRTPLENDGIQELVERVAYTAEPPVVVGRLQIVAEDRGRLRRP